MILSNCIVWYNIISLNYFRIFLEQLKEASGRFLAEKRQAQGSLDVLQMCASGGEIERA